MREGEGEKESDGKRDLLDIGNSGKVISLHFCSKDLDLIMVHRCVCNQNLGVFEPFEATNTKPLLQNKSIILQKAIKERGG